MPSNTEIMQFLKHGLHENKKKKPVQNEKRRQLMQKKDFGMKMEKMDKIGEQRELQGEINCGFHTKLEERKHLSLKKQETKLTER